MEINFHIDENTIKEMSWEEYEAFERAQEGDLKLFRLRPVMARFVMNGNGKIMPQKKAMELLGKIPLSQMQETLEIFVNAIRDGVVPKESRNSSESPSEAVPVGSESPDGSE